MGSGVSRDAESGFRVLTVATNSPASLAGLEAFFDFVVEVNGHCFIDEEESQCRQKFHSIIQNSADRQANLVVFSTKTRELRDVWIVPCNWGGTGLLGATVRFERITNAYSQGVRVLGVAPNSPAASSGLVPYKDYLLGSGASIISELDELIELVTSSRQSPADVGPPTLNVTVYNADSKTVRVVLLQPDPKWGGKGSIGCDIGTGYLHRIPFGGPVGDSKSSSTAAAVAQLPDQQRTAHLNQQQQGRHQADNVGGAGFSAAGNSTVVHSGHYGGTESGVVESTASSMLGPSDMSPIAAANAAISVRSASSATALSTNAAAGDAVVPEQSELERRIAEQISVSQRLLTDATPKSTSTQGDGHLNYNHVVSNNHNFPTGNPLVPPVTTAEEGASVNNSTPGGQYYYTMNVATGTDMPAGGHTQHSSNMSAQQQGIVEQQTSNYTSGAHNANYGGDVANDGQYIQQQQHTQQQQQQHYVQQQQDHVQQQQQQHYVQQQQQDHVQQQQQQHYVQQQQQDHVQQQQQQHPQQQRTEADDQREGQFVNLGGLLAVEEFNGNFGNSSRPYNYFSGGHAPPRPGVLFPVIPPNQRHHHHTTAAPAYHQQHPVTGVM